MTVLDQLNNPANRVRKAWESITAKARPDLYFHKGYIREDQENSVVPPPPHIQQWPGISSLQPDPRAEHLIFSGKWRDSPLWSLRAKAEQPIKPGGRGFSNLYGAQSFLSITLPPLLGLMTWCPLPAGPTQRKLLS